MPCHTLELAPFQGLRYISPDVDRFVDEEFDIARLLAPPYDIPGAQEARELQHSDPHNAARITLPYELGRESHPRYRRAAQLLHSWRSEEHTSELQSRFDLVCRLLLEKKKHN